MSGPDEDPVVALAAPRPDFDGALLEFLIGIISAGFLPANEKEWRTLRDDPPTPEHFMQALDGLPDAFSLDGDGPRFLQDLVAGDFAAVGSNSVEQLLIDSPGGQGVRLNKDLFVKRARAGTLGRPAAAMALLTLQTYAPAGGQGHRTSLRGGGPLTTLIDPRVDGEGRMRAHQQPLWLKIWANVETAELVAQRAPSNAPSDLAQAFPWLLPTRTSERGTARSETTPSDAHPLQVYFGLPRRIRLDFGGPGTCDLTGVEDVRTVVGFRMINYGVQYAGWQHPFTPHYRKKPTEPWLPVHGQPGGLGWRDWRGLALEAPATALHEPAVIVTSFNRHERGGQVRTVRLHAFGYDMDNMKARAWIDATLPVFVTLDVDRQSLLYGLSFSLTEATGLVATALLGEVKRTLFQSAENAIGDVGQVRSDLWAATESDFYNTMGFLAALPDADSYAVAEQARAHKQRFADALQRAALNVFDRWCPAGGLRPDVLRRRVTARHDLVMVLRGYSRLGERVFEFLDVPLPGGGRTARAAAKRARTKASTASRETGK
jgi:CRISPR system Cascade subunit CasA